MTFLHKGFSGVIDTSGMGMTVLVFKIMKWINEMEEKEMSELLNDGWRN
jgi:DNA invertase Pin-like site-specific DNA recombinase